MNMHVGTLTQEPVIDPLAVMAEIGVRAKSAGRALRTVTTGQKRTALRVAADALVAGQDLIVAANSIDMKASRSAGGSASHLDRLLLTPDRIAQMAHAVREIADLDDPVGVITEAWDRPNGLKIERVSTPFGVLGVIFESRPNVAADAGALGLMSGNAVILRAGSDSLNSCRAILACFSEGLAAAGLPEHAIQLVSFTDRIAVGAMLRGLDDAIDVIIPRGGKSLVARVQSEAKVPVFAHLEGIVHIFVEKDADWTRAAEVVVNSKMRRTGVCGAVETLLVDKNAPFLGAYLAEALLQAGSNVRASKDIQDQYPFVGIATEEDWQTEYLNNTISIKSVDGIEGALAHIGKYSSHHTESIITENADIAERFLNEVDSAIVLHNASTQFADGGEFGMGGEIGIATGKMHARGPVGVAQLTSFNYRVRGSGQLRPLPSKT